MASIWESPASFSEGHHIWIGKCYRDLSLLLIFGVEWSFDDLSFKLALCLIIKEIAVWGIWRRDIRGGMVVRIFSKWKQCSRAYVVWHSLVSKRRVFQQPPSWSRLSQLPQGTWCRPYVESEAMWKYEWRHNVTIASDHFKDHDMDWVFGFHQYQYNSALTLTPKHWNHCIGSSVENANNTLWNGMDHFSLLEPNTRYIDKMSCLHHAMTAVILLLLLLLGASQ